MNNYSLRNLDDNKIKELIREEKKIISPFKKELKLENQHYRGGFELESIDGLRKYSVFIRKHKVFFENFSIGLVYNSDEGKIHLLRFNGNHGENIINRTNKLHHFTYHIHKMTAESINAGNLTDPDFVEITKEYASYEQAFDYFCKYINIIDYEKHFSKIGQFSF